MAIGYGWLADRMEFGSDMEYIWSGSDNENLHPYPIATGRGGSNLGFRISARNPNNDPNFLLSKPPTRLTFSSNSKNCDADATKIFTYIICQLQ